VPRVCVPQLRTAWNGYSDGAIACRGNGRTQGQIAILAALARYHTDDHPRAINVAHLEMNQFGASHACAIVRIPDEADQRSGMMSITIPG
jgi:hypothetical protein